jgi:hypothetical protein
MREINWNDYADASCYFCGYEFISDENTLWSNGMFMCQTCENNGEEF